MADQGPDWDWYRTFLAVLETGSLSAAGRAMGLTQPTVGRHIESLESALALKLFTRSFDGFSPTDAAIELKPYATELAASAAALQRVASGHGSGVRGTVRVSASEAIGVEVLPPILAELRHRHRELVIELVLSNKADDIVRREADIAIRMFAPVQEALIAKHLGGIEIGLHAHESYLNVHGLPRSFKELSHHDVIGFDRETAFTRSLKNKLPFFSRSDFALRSDSDLVHLNAIRAGFGIGVCQSRLAENNPALVRVLQSEFSFTMDTWIVMHEDLRSSARCAATFKDLADGLAKYIAGR